MTLPGFEKVFFSTSKNVTIFLELGTNVTISSHRHFIFLGSAWNKTEFQNLARSWVLGSRFFNSGLERPSTSDFCNCVHSVDESGISSRTRDAGRRTKFAPVKSLDSSEFSSEFSDLKTL